MTKKLSLREHLSFGFEQTLTIPDWWTEEGFTSTSDTPIKREKMLDYAKALAEQIKGSYKESLDIWKHMQYEVMNNKGETLYYVTMDPGSIELKTPPVLLKDCQSMAEPIFLAAEKSNIVPYRNWWYGVQGGTEGGCHVNFGGFTDETNPLLEQPELVVKYAAFIHNRPFLHYPFMGLDVGPGGNAMRMDEKEGFELCKDAFKNYRGLYQSGKKLSPAQTYDHFKSTNLISDKASYPSLYKFKDGLYLIEDRGQEALREAEDFYLVANLRMHIFEQLEQIDLPELLLDFPEKHGIALTSLSLWEEFQVWAPSVGLEAEKYKRFFDRQWPVLNSGDNPPENFSIHDGRRPRIIKDVVKRDGVEISKTIDTSFKRFELISATGSSFKIEGLGVEHESKIGTFEDCCYMYFDVHIDKDNADYKISLLDENGDCIESQVFNANNMTWNAA